MMTNKRTVRIALHKQLNRARRYALTANHLQPVEAALSPVSLPDSVGHKSPPGTANDGTVKGELNCRVRGNYRLRVSAWLASDTIDVEGSLHGGHVSLTVRRGKTHEQPTSG